LTRCRPLFSPDSRPREVCGCKVSHCQCADMQRRRMDARLIPTTARSRRSPDRARMLTVRSPVISIRRPPCLTLPKIVPFKESKADGREAHPYSGTPFSPVSRPREDVDRQVSKYIFWQARGPTTTKYTYPLYPPIINPGTACRAPTRNRIT